MKLSDFDYSLPKEFIAHSPSKRRGESKLLVSKGNLPRDPVEHKFFDSLLEYLRIGDVLVVNETKVLKAQLDARKDTGGKVSVMVASKIKDNTNNNFICKVKGSGVKEGSILKFQGGCSAKVISVEKTDFLLSFDCDVEDLLSKYGREPLPPYIKKSSSTTENLKRYQTVYSSTLGSLAAPTAGLHFSKKLLSQIEKKGVKIAKLTLHVSFGTFNSVKVDDPKKHHMDPEWFTVSETAAQTINNRRGRLFVVGTTSLKTLESASDENGFVQSKEGWSDLFIYPGYKFKTRIDALITNFHLPKSTLLMLVSAYYGRERILSLYKLAIKKNYRFFSFGDAMLLILE